MLFLDVFRWNFHCAIGIWIEWVTLLYVGVYARERKLTASRALLPRIGAFFRIAGNDVAETWDQTAGFGVGNKESSVNMCMSEGKYVRQEPTSFELAILLPIGLKEFQIFFYSRRDFELCVFPKCFRISLADSAITSTGNEFEWAAAFYYEEHLI